MSVIVSRAGAADADTLSLLCAEHARYERAAFDPAGHAGRLAALLARTPACVHAWIAGTDGRAFGYATATVDFSTWMARPFTHMDCLFVRDGYRGAGIGKHLLHAIRDFAAANGHGELQWQTPDWNHDAARFYRREGATGAAKVRFRLGVL